MIRLTLNKTEVGVVLQRLAARSEDDLYGRVMEAWLERPGRNVTLELEPREAILVRRTLPWVSESEAS